MEKPAVNAEQVLKELRSRANAKNVKGMARFGINPQNTLGVSIPVLRDMAKRLGKDHDLAADLWRSGVHEARILACLVDDADSVTERQMDRWARDFDSWDVCDQCCSNLFDKTPYAYKKAVQWSKAKEEFVKRAGFVLMATLAVHDKKADDKEFAKFLAIIKANACDSRNFVKKAVDWALRQIGKRNHNLNKMAIATAQQIEKIDDASAKWIASDAISELASESVQERLDQRNGR